MKYQPVPLPRCVGKAMPPGKGEKGLGALIRKSNVEFSGTLHFGKLYDILGIINHYCGSFANMLISKWTGGQFFDIIPLMPS